MATTTAREKTQMETAYGDFIARYPDYTKTAVLDQLRATQ